MKTLVLLFRFITVTVLVLPAAASASDGVSDWKEFFPNGLIDSKGQEISPSVLRGKFVCLYFSAAGCGPCRHFTPKLVAFRNQAKKHMEVVFISQDHSEADQLKYMQESKMEWPAVKWADSRAEESNEPRRLMQKYQGWGIPHVVVLSPSGEVLDPEARVEIEYLPEENVKLLQQVVKEIEEKKENEEYLPDIQKEITEYGKLNERTLRPTGKSGPPAWEDLLGEFYRSQRASGQEMH